MIEFSMLLTIDPFPVSKYIDNSMICVYTTLRCVVGTYIALHKYMI